MPLPALDQSPLQITTSAGPIVSFTDYVIGSGGKLFDLKHAREVEVAGFVGADGKGTFDRGNRDHSLSFTLAHVFGTYNAAVADLLNYVRALPAGGVDMIIALSGYNGTMMLNKASIMAADAHMLYEEGSGSSLLYVNIFNISIKGGALTGAGFLSSPSANEDGTTLVNEDNSTDAPEGS